MQRRSNSGFGTLHGYSLLSGGLHSPLAGSVTVLFLLTR